MPTRSEQPQVELLMWPDAEDRRRELAALGRPRLLLVAASASPPAIESTAEDWIRVPASEQDLAARIRRLQVLADLPEVVPTVDEDGVFRVGNQWVALSEEQTSVAHVLLRGRFGPVSREQLREVAGLDGHGRALDSVIHRLRKRIAPLGLEITSVRGRGYVLAPVSGGDCASGGMPARGR